MSQKKRFKVTIGGQPYTIVGDRSDAHMNAVVELVNNQLKQLEELAPQLTTADRSILMAVNAVSDQLLKEAQIAELQAQIEDLQDQLSQVPRSANSGQVHQSSLSKGRPINTTIPYRNKR
ncbi:TPA: cell division protein ZapA [Streptococcus suis]